MDYIKIAETHGATFTVKQVEMGSSLGHWTADDPACDWHDTKAEAAEEYCQRHNLADYK
jgi:hypothetical protein